MAWENRRRRHRYYYRSRRVANKVTKQYCGKGIRGAAAAEVDLLRRLRAQECKEAFAAILSEEKSVSCALDALSRTLDAWLWAALFAQGWTYQQYQWRPGQ